MKGRNINSGKGIWRLTILFSFLMVCFLSNWQLLARDYFVSVSGYNGNDGLTRETAWATIGWALGHVQSSQQDPAIIHLSEGVFSLSNTRQRFPIALVCKSYVSIIGAGADLTVIDTENKYNKRAFALWYCKNCNIEALTLTGGSGGGLFPDSVGGIIRMVGSSATVKNCKIVDNEAGGIWCTSSNLVVEDCIINDNGANDWGAGINCRFSTVNINNSVISKNVASCNGGGIYLYNCGGQITNNLIYQNYGGGTFQKGGGGGISCDRSSPKIKNNDFVENHADTAGAAIYCYVGSNPVIGGEINEGNLFLGNNVWEKNHGVILYCEIQDSVIDARYNNFNCIPTETEVFPLNQFDISNYQLPSTITNYAPRILNLSPLGNVQIFSRMPVHFWAEAIDYDGDSLSYMWKLNGAIVANDSDYFYRPEENTFQSDTIDLVISDGDTDIYHSWTVSKLLPEQSNFDMAKCLNIGNWFKYENFFKAGSADPIITTSIERVVGTTVINGKPYAIIKDELGFIRYERSDSSRLYEGYYNSTVEYCIYDLALTLGEYFGETWQVARKDTTNNFGVERITICLVDTDSWYNHREFVYSQTFGLVQYTCNFWDVIDITTLKQAKINGMIFTSVPLPEDEAINADEYELYQNYPNPFNNSTVIQYYLPREMNVKICIFNIRGQLLAKLIDNVQEGGMRKIIWQGKDDSGRNVPSGVYFCRLKTEKFTKTIKLLLIR